jgi:hypothetical protein
VGLPPAGAAVEGDAAVLRAPGPRPAAALPRRRPCPLVSGRRRGHVALLRCRRRRRRGGRHGGREELLGDGGGRPGRHPGHRQAKDHPCAFFRPPVSLQLVLRHGACNAVDGAVEGSLGGCHGRACCQVQSQIHTSTRRSRLEALSM